MKYKLEPPHYPIVYVRGYAMAENEREETFHDTYYGFSATSVERRDAPPPEYYRADMFEGQLIRFMKLRKYGYFDATNRGLEDCNANPSRSLWVCRFYDEDVLRDSLRNIEVHAKDLFNLVCTTIPERLKACGVDLGNYNEHFKVILIAHSMGGLVCRALIQNILPAKKENPKDWIHRLVTIGTPNKGIELGAIPDFLEKTVLRTANPFKANIFEEKRMKEYLNLAKDFEPHSLGPEDSKYAFPAKRCLCVIGSDYHSYNAVKHVTGAFSDGLVKQDRAYIVAGKKDANGKYKSEQKAFWANVHRAHSGRRGIVNSYETFENVHRFIFGDIKAEVYLEDVKIDTPKEKNTEYFYDVEFALSISGTPYYLHRRQQDPCENAIRYRREELESKSVLLHTLFMNSTLRDDPRYSYFKLEFRVSEHAIKKGFLWDREYPQKTIYAEEIEVGVADFDKAKPGQEMEYCWLSNMKKWIPAEQTDKEYLIPLREAGSLKGRFRIVAEKWPNEATED